MQVSPAFVQTWSQVTSVPGGKSPSAIEANGNPQHREFATPLIGPHESPWPCGLQALPQAPQLSTSELRSTHALPHRVWPEGHAHTPLRHEPSQQEAVAQLVPKGAQEGTTTSGWFPPPVSVPVSAWELESPEEVPSLEPPSPDRLHPMPFWLSRFIACWQASSQACM